MVGCGFGSLSCTLLTEILGKSLIDSVFAIHLICVQAVSNCRIYPTFSACGCGNWRLCHSQKGAHLNCSVGVLTCVWVWVFITVCMHMYSTYVSIQCTHVQAVQASAHHPYTCHLS